MGKLDVEKKKDLRKNHFEIGGVSANVIKSTYQNVNRPISAQERRDARQQMDKQAMARMKQPHWGAPPNNSINKSRPQSANTFVPHNMINFQWHQPTPFA